MKTYLFAFFLSFFCTTLSFAQITTEWVKGFGTTGIELPSCICSDSLGNSYFAGRYHSSFIICNDTLPTVIQPTNSNQTFNLVISKLNSSGNCIWTKAGISIVPMLNGGAVGPSINDIELFDRYLYSTGVFTDTMIFDYDTLFNSACVSYCTSTFIMKMDTLGNIIWSKCFQGSDSYSGISTIIPYNNGIFVSGSYRGTLILDTVQINALHPWSYNGYIAKLSVTGDCLWAKNTGSSNIGCSVTDIVYDNANSIYLTGDYGDSLILPNIILHDSTPSWARSTYIAKYDTSGNFMWAQGGMTNIRGLIYNQKLCLSNSDDLYFTGSFSDSVRFNSTSFTTASNSWCKDVIVKLDTAGQFLWSIATGNRELNHNYPSFIETNDTGFVFNSSFTDTIIVGNDTIFSMGIQDNLLTQYDDNGNVIWNKSFGGVVGQLIYGISISNNKIYITGSFGGNLSIDSFNIVSMGYQDILVAKFKTQSNIPVFTHNISNFEFIIFPNPTDRIVNVSGNDIIEKLTISNMLGQIIYMCIPNKKDISFQIENEGVYFVTITSNKQILTKKIIVTH